MKAIVYEKYGSADVLRYTDADKPSVGDDEVLVRVSAASINHGDLFAMRGPASGAWRSGSAAPGRTSWAGPSRGRWTRPAAT
ncbi:hypothetical protein [Nonomuraea recticatena]|uniref:hypothetical protein n=1 Tax=Nonomuraea recticatena TaxID=46178 RepID=UPI003607DCA0